MLTRIRNASLVRKTEVSIPHSRVKMAIIQILKREGYVRDVNEEKKTPQSVIRVELKYLNGEPVIRGLKRVSTPGRRVYSGYQTLPSWMPELGIAILSTPLGVMTHRDARKKKVGGEVLCEVY